MIEIIPAIDIINKTCVRLCQGAYDKVTAYTDDIVGWAKAYESIGVKRIHIVDLDGARQQSPQNLDVVRTILAETTLKIEYGGGVKSETALQQVLEAGVERVICGTIALKQPTVFSEWLERYGGNRIVLGLDIKNGLPAVNGWEEVEKSDPYQIIASFIAKGLTTVICTDISRDGMLNGPSVDLYDELMRRFPELTIIASGGVASMTDIRQLNDHKVKSVIVGRAIYENKITLEMIAQWLQNE